MSEEDYRLPGDRENPEYSIGIEPRPFEPDFSETEEDREYYTARAIGKMRRWDWSVPRSFLEELGAPNEQAAYDLFGSILDSMEQDEYTQALRNAFGGQNLPESLMERRQQLADELGIRALRVREREEVAIERMVPMVLALIDTRASAKSKNQDGALVTALLGLQQAITEQTAILREVNERLKRLDG
jgi:hypothetical protein